MPYFIHKLFTISLLTVIILTVTSHFAFCQIFDSGQNPPFLKWRQINTKNFQIIYPSGFESEAQRMAATMDEIIGEVSFSLKKKPRKISVILQNQGTGSNGFVQLAPRRSEFFTTPPQEFDYQDWLNSLAVHELRHVVQFDKLTGGLRAPFFEELALAIFGVTLPPWFYEGDAVDIETALTNAGRGRQPEWNIVFRTNTLTGRKYSYSKDYIGSIHDPTPGYYQLGYFMTTKLRRDYGPGIMDSIFRRVSGNYLRPYNLSSSIRKYTGMGTRQLHHATVQELQKLWEEQLIRVRPADYPAINKQNKQATSYLLPAVTSSGDIIALRRTVDKLPAIISIDKSGAEHELVQPGPQQEPHFSYAAGRIVWDEFRYDKRFQKRSYNVINRYDIASRSYKQITHKTRLFAPALSPDGKTIVAVEISLSNQISLVELDARTGRELKRYASPGNYMLQTPRFNAGAQKIVVIAVGAPGKAIYELNRNTSVFTQLLPFQDQLISRPVYAADGIIFKANYNGIDNLYRLNPANKQIYQITSAKYGAFNPFFDEGSKQLLFNNYQANGYDIASLAYTQTTGESRISNNSVHYEQPLVVQEGNKNVFDGIPGVKYDSRPFREINNLFYVHSITPILEPNNSDNYNFGLKLKSDNKLNTFSFYSAYRFNNGLKKSEYLAGLSYKRFYPILDVSYLNRARLVYQKSSSGPGFIPVSWRDNGINADITVPFVFNRLNKIYSLEITTGTSYTKRYDTRNTPANFSNSISFPVESRLNLSANSRLSAFDLAPKWGQNIYLDLKNFPLTNKLSGEFFRLQSIFFFPGLVRNHSFQASFNYQHANGIYELNSDIPRISGYNHIRPAAVLRNTLLLDYRFPLFYPDWEIGPLAYIKRFKAGFFADFENVGKGNAFRPRTYGAELRADVNFLRFYLPGFDVAGKLILVNEKPRQNPILEVGITYSY